VPRCASSSGKLLDLVSIPAIIDELATPAWFPTTIPVKFTSANYHGLSFGAMLGLGNTTNFLTGKSDSFGGVMRTAPLPRPRLIRTNITARSPYRHSAM